MTSRRRRPLAADQETAALDLGPLPGLVGYVLRRAQLAMFQEFIAAVASLEIRPADYAVLTVIAHNAGINQSRIGAALGIKRSNLVPLIDGLQRRGLIDRRQAEADRRSQALYLTGRGGALLAELNDRVAVQERAICARLGTASRDQLLAALHVLATPKEA